MHYPSQTAAPSRGFPDFLLRAPAASVAEPESGSTTEVSESDEEEGAEEGPPAAVEPINPVLPASPRLNVSNQHTEPQEAGPTSESAQRLLHVVLWFHRPEQSLCCVQRLQCDFFFPPLCSDSSSAADGERTEAQNQVIQVTFSQSLVLIQGLLQC